MIDARLLLLAAGRGSRAGGPKAWRPHRSTSLLESHLDFFVPLLGAAGVSVAIQPEWKDRCRALSPRTLWVEANPDATPLDSLQRLVAASPAARSFVLHVDMPVFDAEVYAALWKADADVAVPVHDGRRGHPVLLSPAALNAVARLDPARDRLDAWLRARGALEVLVAAEAVLSNENR